MSGIIPKLVVFDTNICLDFFVFNDPRYLCILECIKQGSIRALTSPPCREEWLRVLHYPHLPIDETLRPAAIAAFDKFIDVTDNFTYSAIRLPICSDKDDQKFLETAQGLRVDYLISKDKALLKLARRVSKLGLFKIMTPELFLSDLTINDIQATS